MKTISPTLLFVLMLLVCTSAPLVAAEPKMSGVTLVRLDDVQGLQGGQTLVLDSEGNVFVTLGRDGKEYRYHIKLPENEIASMRAFISASGIADYRERKRAGVPDESRPRITVTLPNQEAINAAKWANDKDPKFDKLYQHLLQLVARAAKSRALEGDARRS